MDRLFRSIRLAICGQRRLISSNPFKTGGCLRRSAILCFPRKATFRLHHKLPQNRGPPHDQDRTRHHRKTPVASGIGADDHETYGFSCGPGWFPILERLFDESEQIQQEDGLTVTVLRVKEKFGELRVYFRSGNERVQYCLRRAEEEAFYTCESCGGLSPGIRSGGRLSDLCDDCRKQGR